MLCWVLSFGVKVVRGACLSEERRVKSEKSKCFEDYCRKHYVSYCAIFIVPADLQLSCK